jgi:hypothetical protein
MSTYSIVCEFDQVLEGEMSEQKFLKSIVLSLKKSAFQSMCTEFIFVTDENLSNKVKSNLISEFSILEFQLNIRFELSFQPGYYEKKKTGYKVSVGDIVIFVDSDCLYSDNYFDQILSAFTATEIGIVSGRTFALIETRKDALAALLWQFPIKGTGDPRNEISHQWGNNFAARREILQLIHFRTLQPSRPTFRVLGFVWDSQVKSSAKRIFVEADAFHKQFSSFMQLAKRVYEQGREQQVIAKWCGIPIYGRITGCINGMGWNSMNRISTLCKEMKLTRRTRFIMRIKVFLLRGLNAVGYLFSIALDRKVIIK